MFHYVVNIQQHLRKCNMYQYSGKVTQPLHQTKYFDSFILKKHICQCKQTIFIPSYQSNMMKGTKCFNYIYLITSSKKDYISLILNS